MGLPLYARTLPMSKGKISPRHQKLVEQCWTNQLTSFFSLQWSDSSSTRWPSQLWHSHESDKPQDPLKTLSERPCQCRALCNLGSLIRLISGCWNHVFCAGYGDGHISARGDSCFSVRFPGMTVRCHSYRPTRASIGAQIWWSIVLLLFETDMWIGWVPNDIIPVEQRSCCDTLSTCFGVSVYI